MGLEWLADGMGGLPGLWMWSYGVRRGARHKGAGVGVYVRVRAYCMRARRGPGHSVGEPGEARAGET